MLIAFFVNDMAREFPNYTTTVLAHHGPIALRQRHDELVRVGEPGRALDFLLGRAWLAVGDVLRQRAVEQDRLLLHDGDLRAERCLL